MMRGRTQARLMETDDGSAYVVKLSSNPLGRRVLVNELIGSILLAQLGLATPERAFVRIDGECLSDGDPLRSGLHFGSRYPGASGSVAVYDFLPKALVPKVSNLDHFFGALMFDQWTSNTDRRQAIFFRQFVSPEGNAAAPRPLVAQMIDNGSILGEGDWGFPESAGGGYYGIDLSVGDFEPWLDLLADLNPDVLKEIVAEVPLDWIRSDGQALEGLLVRLYKRRVLVPVMIQQVVASFQASLRLSPRYEGSSPTS